MAFAMKFGALALLVIGTCVCLPASSIAQMMPYRATTPACKGKCGSPLCGPCVTETPYAYVPTRWRRWPVTQASATMAPEELPTPTPAKAPSTEEPATGKQVPQLPLGSDLPVPGPRETPTPSSMVPQLNSPAPSGDNPQVPVFGDEPQTPPSAADPLSSTFNDEPPQPPADAEEGVPGAEPAPSSGLPSGTEPATPSEPNPSVPAAIAPGTTPSDASSTTTPARDMPFDVGPPQMPADDPFEDDPVQEPAAAPQTRTRLEQSYRETYGLPRAESQPLAAAASVDSAPTVEPRLLQADGRSLDAARLPAEANEPNPLRQVSHPGRRTVATEAVALPAHSKPVTNVRRNPLRDR